MPEPYSPLRYPGGKAGLSAFIIEILKCNHMREPHYIEPYAGGAGAALRLLFEEYVEEITINDADPRIKCFWLAITKENERFIEKTSKVDISIDEWYRQREIYKECNLHNPFEVGFATFFLNRTTRSGIIHNGGPIGGYNQKGNYKIDARFNRKNLIRRIARIGAYSDRISVDGKDGLVLLKKIDEKSEQAKRTFVYLDPPYYVKGSELYLNKFTHNQHWQLAKYLSLPKKFPWILTYDNSEAILKFYAKFSQFCFFLNYSANERRKGEELLIYPDSVLIPQTAKQELILAA